MTHDELMVQISNLKADAAGDVWLIHNDRCCGNCTCKEMEKEVTSIHNALLAVVYLHKPKINGDCPKCVFMIDPMGKSEMYPHPCPTIQAIEKELI